MGKETGSRISPPPPDFRRLFRSVPGLYLVLTPEFDIIDASDAYLQATMTRREAVVGRGLFEIFPDNPNDPAADGVRNLRASLNRVLELRAPDTMAVQKYDVRRPGDGTFEERYWSPMNSPVFGEDGELLCIIHRAEDVTEFMSLKRKEAEREELTQALRIRGDRMEVEIFHRAQEIQEANRLLHEAKAGLETKVSERTNELARANEALKAEMDQHSRLEEQFRQAQKMDAVGKLAGGVAHDFNNLLTAILLYGNKLLAGMQADDPSHGAMEQIVRAGERAAALTRQLLAFSRQQVLEPKVLDLNAVVEGMEQMLRRLIGEDIRLSTALDPGVGRVKADPGQIEQVILNLAVNARDAMPRGGRVILETRNIDLDDTYAWSHIDAVPGRYVMLAVSDTGEGMSKEIQERVFEPFFTTKAHGKGTGLGLSTVFGIVKQSGGWVWLYSEPGHGTAFKIYLPRVDATDDSPEGSVEPAVGTAARESVLLVEDDDVVREVTAATLEELGYVVIAAGNGEAALAAARAHEGRIDLLVTDVIMPGMPGPKVAEAMQLLRPGIKVLFLSGYTDDAMVHHGLREGEISFLQKPFTLEALARKVRETLSLP
jgi:signal transduction histidine kinase/CheY-like chemotaxis protein